MEDGVKEESGKGKTKENVAIVEETKENLERRQRAQAQLWEPVARRGKSVGRNGNWQK